jgi:hypothetical protein
MKLDLNEIGHLEATLWDRSQVSLRSLWESGPLVLVFLRHYG